MDREATARAIAEQGRRLRTRPPRWLWVAAIVVSVICVGGLAYGWIAERDTTPAPASSTTASGLGGGLGLGLMIGIGVGIAIGTAVGVRRSR